MDEIYQANILDHYKHPRNGRPLAEYDVKERGSNPSCGDDLMLYIKFSKPQDSLELQPSRGETLNADSQGLTSGGVASGTMRIADIGYDSAGCAISTAAMSLLSEEVKGKSCDEVTALSEKSVYDLLGVPIGPEREKCALLGLRTLQNALRPKV